MKGCGSTSAALWFNVRFRALRSQVSKESLFSLLQEIPVTLRIDERIRPAFLHARKLLLHPVIRSMRPQIHIALERFQHSERAREILGNRRVLRVVHQTVAIVSIRAADNDHMVGLPMIVRCQSKRGASLRMPRRVMRNQRHATQRYALV